MKLPKFYKIIFKFWRFYWIIIEISSYFNFPNVWWRAKPIGGPCPPPPAPIVAKALIRPNRIKVVNLINNNWVHKFISLYQAISFVCTMLYRWHVLVCTVYYEDNSHNLSNESLYTYCTDFNFSHAWFRLIRSELFIIFLVFPGKVLTFSWNYTSDLIN